MVKGVHTVWCQVSDMDRALRFYSEVLGLQPGYTSPYWSEFDLGNGKLGLHHHVEGTLGDSRGWVVGLVVEDLEAFRHKLAPEGVYIAAETHEIPSGVVLDFADPDGNPMQAVQLRQTTAAA